MQNLQNKRHLCSIFCINNSKKLQYFRHSYYNITQKKNADISLLNQLKKCEWWRMIEVQYRSLKKLYRWLSSAAWSTSNLLLLRDFKKCKLNRLGFYRISKNRLWLIWVEDLVEYFLIWFD